jgi:hypothetical protein
LQYGRVLSKEDVSTLTKIAWGWPFGDNRFSVSCKFIKSGLGGFA